MTKEPIRTVKDFVSAIGRAKFEKELGHKSQVVSRAISENIMPAHWYVGCRDLGRDAGVDVPESLFRWHHGRSDVGSQNANVKTRPQGKAAAG